MQVYLYRAALWCGPCMIGALIHAGKAAPAAAPDMAPADALYQITQSNGFDSESDYDSDDLPKGPYDNGGGEADCPQHCDGCGVFLENPLTPDGVAYVKEQAAAYIASDDEGESWAMVADRADDDGKPVIAEWVRFYFAPGM